jgi:hypothetical protein
MAKRYILLNDNYIHNSVRFLQDYSAPFFKKSKILKNYLLFIGYEPSLVYKTTTPSCDLYGKAFFSQYPKS